MIIEKSMDNFESGVATLLERNHFPHLDHIDALSLRCFAFARDGGVEDWFRPVISCEAAIKRLESLMGLEGYWEVLPYHIGQKLPEGIYMIGPIRENILLPDLKRYYYHGDSCYFCYEKRALQAISICDFSGMPMIPFEEFQLREILDRNIPYLIRLKPLERENDFSDVWNYRLLLTDGLQFNKSFRQKNREELTCQKSGREYISLQYALMNYGIQMRKMVHFVEAAIGLEEDVRIKINRLWMELQQIRTEAEVAFIPAWEDNIWEVIWEYAENKGIVL